MVGCDKEMSNEAEKITVFTIRPKHVFYIWGATTDAFLPRGGPKVVDNKLSRQSGTRQPTSAIPVVSVEPAEDFDKFLPLQAF